MQSFQITMRLHGVSTERTATSDEDEVLSSADILRECSVNGSYLHTMLSQNELIEVLTSASQNAREMISDAAIQLNVKANESISKWQPFEGKSNRQAFEAYRKNVEEVN